MDTAHNVRRSLYEIIGVSPSATPEAIEQACLQLAEENRPDKNPGSESAARLFADVEEAYSTLTDPGKRAGYDATWLAQLEADWSSAESTSRAAQQPPPQWGIAQILYAALFILVCYVAVMGEYERIEGTTFNGDGLALAAAGIGGVAGIAVIALLWQRGVNFRKGGWMFAVLAVFTTTASSGALLLNRWIPSNTSVEREFKVVSIREREPMTWFRRDNDVFKKTVWDGGLMGADEVRIDHCFNYSAGLRLKTGSVVRFTVKTGLFGYEFFSRFEVLK